MRGDWEEIILSPESFYLLPADIDKEKEMIFISGLYFYYLIFAKIPFEDEINQFQGKRRNTENDEVKWKKKGFGEEGKYLEKDVNKYSKETILKFYEGCLQDLLEKINQQIFFVFPKNQLIEIFQKLLHPDPSKRYSKQNLLEDPIWKINAKQKGKDKEKEKLEQEKIKYKKEIIERDISVSVEREEKTRDKSLKTEDEESKERGEGSIIFDEREEKTGDKSLKTEDEESKERGEGSIIFDEKLLKIFEKEDKKVKREREREGRSFVTKQAIGK